MKSRRLRRRSSADRWMISYADFLTLLLACFVVMYAMARGGRAGAINAPVAAPTAPVVPSSAMTLPFENLKRQLEPEIENGAIRISLEERGIVISLQERTFFPSGQDTLYPDALESIGKVADVIRPLPNPVHLEGHTDSVPVHNGRFRSNWELSAARSIALLKLFNQSYGLPVSRFAITGYADNLPLAGNESEPGRAQNRRVDVVILRG